MWLNPPLYENWKTSLILYYIYFIDNNRKNQFFVCCPSSTGLIFKKYYLVSKNAPNYHLFRPVLEG